MSRFYASIGGSAKTEATRRGTANKPCYGHIRGWDVGVEVSCWARDDADEIEVVATYGSNGRDKRKYVIAKIRHHPDTVGLLVEVWTGSEFKAIYLL